jgi:hypothetical protein
MTEIRPFNEVVHDIILSCTVLLADWDAVRCTTKGRRNVRCAEDRELSVFEQAVWEPRN